MRLPLPRHPLSVAGVVLTTIGAALFLIFFLLDLFGLHTNPYIGLVSFLILPAVFVFGLLLIPLGGWLDRRRVRRGGAPRTEWPRLDFNDARQRAAVVFFVVATVVNVVIVSLAAYSGVRYMDTPEFCGQVCHQVMEPEYVAFQNGPHSGLECVECHIGPGAGGFVRAKLNGLNQVKGVIFNDYARPIPAPVHTLSAASDTCEQCHWSEKFHGDVIKEVRDYAEDETNTETVTTLVMHVGGGSAKLGTATGIHWHMNLANEIDYIATDDKRQAIPWVRLKDQAGNVREYVADGVTPEMLARGERRRMDCIDCHNRASHIFDSTPERAVNRALTSGLISKSLPYVRREATAALKDTYPSREAAVDAIATRLRTFYTQQPGDLYNARRADVDRAIAETQQLYRRNVYQRMNLTWGTYPNNIGHMDFPGCFRCHDDSHKAKDGRVISQDCAICHDIK